MRRTEALDGEPQGLGRSGQQPQALAEDEPHPTRVRERLAEDDALAPGAALDERRAQDDRAQRPPVALTAREQAIDEQLERAAELLARRRFLELEDLLERLRGTARAKRRVAAKSEVVGEQAGRSETVGHRRARERRELTERAHAEAVEHLGQRRRLVAEAQQ